MKHFVRKRTIISAILIVTLLLATFVPTSAQSQSEETIDPAQENEYNKIHFYFDNEAYTTIDDEEELKNAIESLYEHGWPEYYEVVKLTIQFDSDICDEHFV